MSACDPALKVFLVEDHADTLATLRRFLERQGCEVQCAWGMEQALHDLPESGCDVLISDIGLPDGDGWELLRRANLATSVYAIAISGFGTLPDQMRSREAGYRHHLLKPFDPKDLAACLHEAAREKGEADLGEGLKNGKTQTQRGARG
jgi:DNA-binding response OmpR family regulator